MSMQHPQPIPAVAAVIVADGKLLLIRRGTEPSKGKWSVPGGRVEFGETLEDALKREVREETGLEIEVGDLAGVYELIVHPTLNAQLSTLGGLAHHYVIIDYFARVVGGELKAGDDADDARWVPTSALDEYQLTEHLRERIQGWLTAVAMWVDPLLERHATVG